MYIVAGVVILLGLIAAYRTLGGAAASEVNGTALMRSALSDATAVATELSSALQHPVIGAGQHPDPLRGAAAAWRRRSEGQAQQLARIDAAALDEPRAAAQALLAVAVDELAWAARLCAADAYASSEGMQAAAGVLCEHAHACLREAAALLGESGVAKEGERSR